MRIGIDIGATNTKIVVADGNRIVSKDMFLSSSGNNLDVLIRKLDPDSVESIHLTGGNKKDYPKEVFGLKPVIVGEIDAITAGVGDAGALIVSIGTGTCLVRDYEHLGGTGVGGGTYAGLCKLLTGVEDFNELDRLSGKGSLEKVDLSVGDIIGDSIKTLDRNLTASNFAKTESLSKADLVLGVQNLVAESIFSNIAFAVKAIKPKKVVLIGKMVDVKSVRDKIIKLCNEFDIDVIVMDNPAFVAAFGATR